MIEYKLFKSNRKNKKYMVEISNKKIHFGDNRYEDYTMHNDTERKKRYIQRHINDNINNYYYPGFWSMHLLWNKKTIEESIKDIKKKFNLKKMNKI